MRQAVLCWLPRTGLARWSVAISLVAVSTVLTWAVLAGSAEAATRSTSTSVTGCSPASVAINQSTTCTVLVSDTDSGTASAPAGTASFASSGTGGFSGSPCTLAQVGLTTTSSCTVTYTPTAGAGTHTITASYTPNDSVHAASSDTTGVGVTVTANGSTTTLSVSPSPAITNQAVTLTATVTSSVSPSGSVTFYDGSTLINGCANVELATQGATCPTSFAASTSPKQLTAVFTSNSSSVAGSSGAATLSVNRDLTSISLAASSPVVNVGSTATYTASVIPSHAGPFQPSGSVAFLDGRTIIRSCASQTLTHGIATCTLSYGSTGGHTLTAAYRGDLDFANSASAPRSVTVLALGTITSTMQWTFYYTRAYTKIHEFVVNSAPVGATVVVKCHGVGCPFAKRATTVKRCKRTRTHKCSPRRWATIGLAAGFRKHRLHVGTRVNVQIIRPGWIGKYYLFTMRAGRGPKIQISCLAPGKTVPGHGC